MQDHAPPTKRRTLTEHDDPASIAAWAKRMVVVLDSDLPSTTVGRVGQVAEALVDNAQRHGAPPVTIEVSTSTAVTVEVTDHGPVLPVARTDGTGSLAMISIGQPDTVPKERQRPGNGRTVGSHRELR